MPLSSEEIKKLLALPTNRGRGRHPKDWVDTSVRDYQTWFKLNHKLWDEEREHYAKCDNPDCKDYREGRNQHMVAEVDGTLMCRICFLDGYLLTPKDQLELPTN